MEKFGLHVADGAFFVGHTGLILFNVFGWIFPNTRKWNLATLLFTLAAWLLLGLFYGIGYCPLTEWHFQVRRALGYEDTSDTFVHLLILEVTGLNLSSRLVNASSGVVLAVSLAGSIATNVRDRLRARTTNVARKPEKATTAESDSVD